MAGRRCFAPFAYVLSMMLANVVTAGLERARQMDEQIADMPLLLSPRQIS